jgi:CheY-like chemotaxis protein
MAKILVCDDEQEILDITRLILEEEGYQVMATIDSGRVAHIVEKEMPDVLLIDLWMPGMSGDQVISQLRKDEKINHLPIVVISASKDGKEIAYASGADDFLEKPYDIEALLAIVQKQLTTSYEQ